MASLRPLVSAWFQGLFTPLLGVLFTFPSRYSFTIGLLGVFSLAGWCRPIHTGFLRSRATQDPRYSYTTYMYGTFTPYGRPFQNLSISYYTRYRKSYNPAYSKIYGLGSSAFARHYSQNHYCFLILQVLRCFSSPGSPYEYINNLWVAPFGHLRITDRVHLPVAFRSLPRPSSPPEA